MIRPAFRALAALPLGAALALPAAAQDAVVVAERPAVGPPAPFRMPEVEEFRLENGLRVVLFRREAMPLVTGRLIVDAGAEHEPADRNGLALLTGALIPEGTAEMSGPELADRMERLGAQFQAGAGQNLAYVVVTGLKPVFGEALGLAADATVNAAFAGREFERVRGQAVAAHVQSQSTVEGLANEAFSRAVFAAEAPYARPASGTAASLQRIERQDVVDWHARMFVPSNATLLLVGDLSGDEARAIAREAFGAWAGAPVRLEPSRNPVRPVARTRVILVDRPGSVQSAIRVGHAAVPATDPDYIRLAALAQVLGGGFNARINQNLRERHGWTYGAFASFAPLRGAGTLYVSSSVRTGATDSALVETVGEFRRIVDEPVPEAELRAGTNNLTGSFPASVQTVQGLAQRMQNVLVWGLPLDFYATYLPRLDAVTVEDVSDVGRRRVHPEALVVVVAGDLAQIEGPIRALELGDVEVWDADGGRVR